MRTLGVLLLVVTLAGCAASLPGARATDEPLPTDPALVTGTLDNGLTYLIRKHGNPEGRVAVWLHVATGSLNETEETRGIAHYLEHMAFNGSANFPPGSVVPYFQSLGLSFGRDQNAFTGFDQTTYQLALPSNGLETLDRGLLFMADVATRLSLLPAEVDNERQIILEEKRTRAGAGQRTQDYIYERLTPGSTFGRRLPIGTEAAIKAVTSRSLREYYARWYVPGAMTVMVVGDCDPGAVAGLIRRQFGAARAVPRSPNRDVGVKPDTTTRAIVATDPELTEGDVSISQIEPARGPTTTVAQYRRDLVEQIGTWVFNRRVNAELAAGRVAFLDARASIRQQAGVIRMRTVEASGKPELWRAMLADLGADLQRARLYGFSERELRDARTALIADAEEAVRREATLPARALLRQLNAAVTRREPVMSATQRLALLRRLLPDITADEVSRVFASNFEPTPATFIAELPSGRDVPGETELIALGRQAVNVTPERPTEAALVASLPEPSARGGTIVESDRHAASDVTSAWLDNGVRVHYRFVGQRKNEAAIVATLAGGQIQETADTRGLTDAAAQAWDRPATGTLSSVQVRDLMTGKKVRVDSRVGGDTLTLTVSGDPVDLPSGLQLAYLLLTDPLLEPAALAQWKDAQRQVIAARKLQPVGVATEVMAGAFIPPDEPRTRPLEERQVEAITLDAAQAWLRKLITEAPIEVAVVGDLDRDTAINLVERYLGALPARDRIGAKTLQNLRTITRTVGPIRVDRRIDAKTPQGFVVDGFFGADVQNVRDARLLTLAARVLTTRMIKTIREEKQLVYSIGAASLPANEYPGLGRFVAQAPTDPAKADALATALEEMYAAFAKAGPSEDEMTVARKQLANILDEAIKDPDFWLSRLSTLDYRGLSLTDVVDAPAAYQRLTAGEVREAFARYWTPPARFRFVITPN